MFFEILALAAALTWAVVLPLRAAGRLGPQRSAHRPRLAGAGLATLADPARATTPGTATPADAFLDAPEPALVGAPPR